MYLEQTKEALKFNRTYLRKVMRLVTDHCYLKEHLHNMGLTKEELLFRLCDGENKTTSHIIFKRKLFANWGF